MTNVDLLITAPWVLPIEPAGQILADHTVAIRDGRILAVEPASRAQAQFQAVEQVELPGQILMPGLVNAHGHAAMSLFRGVADDLPLQDWLEGHIWPLEGQFVDAAFCRTGVELAAAEMLRGGITCFNDMYFFPEATAQVAATVGLRACVGLIVLDFPTAYAANPTEYLQRGTAVHDEYRGHPLISTALAPHAPYTVSDEPLARIRAMADELDIPIHMHVHETLNEVTSAVADLGQRPLARLADLGLLNERLIAVHMTTLDDGEIEQLGRSGCHVVHCPESNLKLASGLCPVQRLLDAGVNVALGTDGAASNNDLDLLGEMRTAALLGKMVAGDARALDAHSALRMATLGGARALGLAADTGSIEVGKWADLCAIELGGIESLPLYDPASQLVYASSRNQVRNVWVAGRRLLRERQLTSIDAHKLIERVEQLAAPIAAARAQQ